MKIFLFIFFLFPFLISAPLSTDDINGTSTKWSAGVCCKTGTDYQLSFLVKNKKANRLTIDSICYEGHVFPKLRIKNTDNGETISYTVSFNYRQDNVDENNQEEQQHNGVSPAPIYNSCSDQVMHYTYRGKKYDVSLPKMKKAEQLPRP